MSFGGKSVAHDSPDEELDALSHAVIGATIEVHRHLGPGYLEALYEDALSVEFSLRDIPFERQKPIAVLYKSKRVGEGRLDFLVAERLVVELKTADELASVHQAQVLSYLRTTGLKLGLLLNFNVSVLRNGIKRVILS